MPWYSCTYSKEGSVAWIELGPQSIGLKGWRLSTCKIICHQNSCLEVRRYILLLHLFSKHNVHSLRASKGAHKI